MNITDKPEPVIINVGHDGTNVIIQTGNTYLLVTAVMARNMAHLLNEYADTVEAQKQTLQ